MQESQFYQLIIRETTIENTLALLEDQFLPETISLLKPALLKINDIQRLKQILRAARRVDNLEAFSEMLREE